MEKLLGLDEGLVAEARRLAGAVTAEVLDYIDRHTTVAIERASARLFGLDGVDSSGVSLPNVVVDDVCQGQGMSHGAAYWLANAVAWYGTGPQEVAEAVARGEMSLTRVPRAAEETIREMGVTLARRGCLRIQESRAERERLLAELGEGGPPYLYVIVATGNIYEDVLQAEAAARKGADIVAVIRSTGQSLLDYVPYGPTTEGYGGTFATQENFRIMRAALDRVGREMRKYIRLVNYCSGLCMPEIAVMGAFERLDMMLNDAMYGILFRDINMRRTFIDQHFSRMVNAYAGIVINTGEDNYLTTDDALEAAHTVLASQFINERFARRAGLPEAQIGLGSAFEIDPEVEDSFLYELAQARMTREIFPGAPLKYMPPTRHATGNIFQANVLDALFNLAAVATGQAIVLLGMPTEALHTPYMHDRYLGLENARYVFRAARHLAEELVYRPGGRMGARAQGVLAQAVAMLREIERVGLVGAIERGMFARVKRHRDGGKGAEGVVKKADDYFNPFFSLMSGDGEVDGDAQAGC